MSSASGETAVRYHEATKHSYASVRQDPHFLDWENQPLAFKIYRDAETLPLPSEREGGEQSRRQELRGLDVHALGHLLHYAAGVTKRFRHRGGEMLFRAAACTGALYHVELYVASGPLEGLDAGLYHFGPRDRALARLRPGDWRTSLVEAAANDPGLASAEVILVSTTTYWRNAWKYRSRAYRHAFWDTGTILANLFEVARSMGIPAHLCLGFADDEVYRLLDLNPDKEVATAIAGLGRLTGARREPPSPVSSLGLTTEPLSGNEIDYPLIREMHAASSLERGEVAPWRDGARVPPPSADSERPSLALPPAKPPVLEGIEEVIRRRGSARRFERAPVSFEALSFVLSSSIRPVAGDVFPEKRTWNDVYVIANDVSGLPSGAYVYHPEHGGLSTLKTGDFRSEARFLDLEQDLAGDASFNVYLLAPLEEMLERFGDRGYRVAQLEGGILGGRIYLAAYASGLGASGLTFYDDAVTEFFSPHAAGKAVMFLVAVGIRAKRKILFQR